VLKGGLEFSAERSLESGRTRLRRCITGCQQATSRAGAKRCLNGKNGCLLDKGWRKVNHRVIEQAPGNGHVLGIGGSTLRQDRAEHDGRGSEPGNLGQEPMSASPDAMG
jgi:hypothetical protein